MTSFTTPLGAHLGAQPSSHPVHRATALLHQALTPASAEPDPAELWDGPPFRLDRPIDLNHGPVSLTTPDDSLVTLLGFAPFEYVPLNCQPPVTDTPDVGAADGDEGEDMLDHAVQAQLQGLVQAFHRRQRQASLLVACSIAAAVILTLGGLILLFGAISPGRADQEKASLRGETSVARSPARAALEAPPLTPIRVSNTIADSAFEAKIITTRPEQPLALGPHLPPGVARYVLLRGLPENATLSAGRRTGAGTWMVRGEDIGGLTLTLDEASSGDYPTEIYLLDPDRAPQARQRFVLRIDTSPRIYSAGLALRWPTVFPEMSQASEPAQTQTEVAVTPTEPAAEQEQAPHLLADGDLVTARRVLTERAEQGQPDAAYKLGLTFDDEILARAGFEDVQGDTQTAQAWYLRAAQAGHAGALQRLEMMSRGRAGV